MDNEYVFNSIRYAFLLYRGGEIVTNGAVSCKIKK